MLWLSSIETSEPVGIPLNRVAMIEQKPLRDGNVVAVFLDTGQEVRVAENLADIKARLETLHRGG